LVARWPSYVRSCDHTHQFALNMRNLFLGSTNFCEHPLSDFTIGCLQTASPPETKRWPSAVARLLGCQRASATRDAAFSVLILTHDLQDG